MKSRRWYQLVLWFQFFVFYAEAFPTLFIPANHPNLQYVGRWDMSNPLRPLHSWPGVQIYAEFSGTSIGVRMADSENYYNVYIDGKLHSVFHGSSAADSDYTVASDLKNERHTFLLNKRNCAQNTICAFAGLWLDEGAQVFPPPPQPERRIEFIGDSFTVAEGNEATAAKMPWHDTFPVTNIDQSFAAIITRHFHAQYHVTARSGIGMVTDWSGNRSLNMPDRFDRALMDAPEPKWDFQQWQPDLVVVCLGLNDYSGLKEKDGHVSAENSTWYRSRYHDFLATLRRVYPGKKIIAVAAHVEWMRENVQQVVQEEHAQGKAEVTYAQFDYIPEGYVANGHPTVAAHEKIAAQLLPAIEGLQIFK